MADPLDIEALIGGTTPTFQPTLFYSQESDALQFYHEDVPYYDERIDCWLTVYKELETHRLIGFKLNNLRVLLSRFDELELAYRVSQSGKAWSLMAQPMLAYIPVVMESPPDEQTQYRDVLTSFGEQIREPVEVAYA